MSEPTFEKVSELMVRLFDLDPGALKPETKFEELDLTSLDAIDLVVELQALTGKKVDEEGLKKVRTVGDVVSLVESQLAA